MEPVCDVPQEITQVLQFENNNNNNQREHERLLSKKTSNKEEIILFWEPPANPFTAFSHVHHICINLYVFYILFILIFIMQSLVYRGE